MRTQVLPAGRSDSPPLSRHNQHESTARVPYYVPVVDNCVSCTLRKSNFSCDLSKGSLDRLDRIKHATAYPEGALILGEGQAPHGVYVLCQGRAKLMATNREGKTLILRIAQAGEILGLHSAVTGLPYALSVVTLQPSQLAFIGRDDLLRFLREHGNACLRVAQQLSNDCHSAYEEIHFIGMGHSVAEKLARLLLQWSPDGQTINGTIRLKLALTHEEMAQLMGTTRETVTRTLSRFKERHILEQHGSTLFVLNKAALERMLVC